MRESKAYRPKSLRVRATVLALLAVGGTHVASAEPVNNASRNLTVKYTGGVIERYAVNWTGDVTTKVWETGGPAIPLQGKFVDDRVCHWEISGSVTRQVFLVSLVGQQFASPTLTRVYDKGKANEGATFKLLGLRGENCGDAAGRRNSDLADMKRLVASDFQTTVDIDFKAVQAEIKQDAKVLNVSEPRSRVAKAEK